ncbi:MAG TPA: DUF983 domain-containing protein [Chitinophagales bacterium]|nr:DUF983 domain-containing protein [Chitinophagales bacterium]
MDLRVKKGSKLFSIVHLKCPHCQQGNLFSVSKAYNLKRMLDMPARCPVCNQDFKIEPGFYSGALWVSYPIVVIVTLPLALTLLFRYHFSILPALLVPFAILFALQPLIMRYSRAIWINVVVSYDPETKTDDE